MLLFVDESGQDRGAMPCEVLAGIAITEQNLWSLVKAIRGAEKQHFGDYLRHLRTTEVKARRLLKRKTFRLASRPIAIPTGRLPALANSFLRKGLEAHRSGRDRSPATALETTGYARSAIRFVHRVLDIAAEYGVKVFASIIDIATARPEQDILHKDFVYLFERYFYYLETLPDHERGLVVFDELEKTKAQKLIQQMAGYFLGTSTGRSRSSKIIPEPFFVHSELTTGVLLADLVAYILSWGWRWDKKMPKECRDELKPYALKLSRMQFEGEKSSKAGDKVWPLHGITYIRSLRSKTDKVDGLRNT